MHLTSRVKASIERLMDTENRLLVTTGERVGGRMKQEGGKMSENDTWIWLMVTLQRVHVRIHPTVLKFVHFIVCTSI